MKRCLHPCDVCIFLFVLLNVRPLTQTYVTHEILHLTCIECLGKNHNNNDKKYSVSQICKLLCAHVIINITIVIVVINITPQLSITILPFMCMIVAFVIAAIALMFCVLVFPNMSMLLARSNTCIHVIDVVLDVCSSRVVMPCGSHRIDLDSITQLC
jgi:hypothetical protein